MRTIASLMGCLSIAAMMIACGDDEPGDPLPALDAGNPPQAGGGGAGGGSSNAGSGGSGSGAGNDAGSDEDAGASTPVGPCLPRVVGSGQAPLIDDFEDEGTEVSPVDGRSGYNFAFNGATNTATLESVPGGAPGSTRARRLSGSGTLVNTSGWGIQLNAPGAYQCPFDASNYVGVAFWARSVDAVVGLGTRVSVASDHTCYETNPTWQCFDWYSVTTSIDSTWRRYELLWGEFRFSGFAPQAQSRPPGQIENLYQIDFVPEAPDGAFAFEVDDLEFLVGDCGSGVCDPARPCPSDCCGNDQCERHELSGAGGAASLPGAKASPGVAYCAADCAPDADGCPAAALAASLPQTIRSNTARGADDFAGACNANTPGAPDLEYAFVAPADGTYSFRVESQDFEPVLYVLDGHCSGAELSCDTGGPLAATSQQLESGQGVTLVVDGTFGSRGPFTLDIEQIAGACPDESLGSSLPLSVSGTTSGKLNGVVPACGDAIAPDHSYTWTAPEAGLYAFTLANAPPGGALELRRADCNGPSLGCMSTDTLPTPRLTAQLDGGQGVAVTVDGPPGEEEYTLSITRVECPTADLGSEVPFTTTGTIAGAPHLVTTTCGAFGSSQVALTWTAPASGSYVFDTVGSSFDTLLGVFGGAACGGLLACDDDSIGSASRYVATLLAGQSLTLLIQGFGGATGNYALNVSPCSSEGGDAGVPACPLLPQPP